jgi:hypothetical protein
MDQSQAKTQLGLNATAPAERVERAYKQRSRLLKRRLVAASTVEERERYRAELRTLVYTRDIALGPTAAAAHREQRRQRAQSQKSQDWWSPSTGIPDRIRTRESALVFFGLGVDASSADVRRAFFQRSRALKREIAHAQTDADLQLFQNTLRRLNDLLNLCLHEPADEPPLEPVMLDLPIDPDATCTEVGQLFEAPESEADQGPELEVQREQKPKLKVKLSDSVWDIDIEAGDLKKLRPHKDEGSDS